MTNEQPTILLVNDVDEERKSIVSELERNNYSVRAFRDDRDLLRTNGNGDVLISKLALRGNGAGIKLIRSWKREHPDHPVLGIAAPGEDGPVEEAIRAGASDCIKQPIDVDRLAHSINRVLTIRENDSQGAAASCPGFESMIGTSPALQRVQSQARRVAPTTSTVLVAGATGTGKELLADSLHRLSARSQRPFVAINVAAVPSSLIESELFGHVKGAFTDAATERIGRFEAAHGGTLFIDEIGDLKLHSQAKLLRVLETRVINRVGSNEDIPIDVRVVAATSRNLESMVKKGSFREDLYYRLNVVRIRLPSLCERSEDIAPLTEHFLQTLAKERDLPQKRLSPALLDHMTRQEWPGNIRQLKNCVESMVVISPNETLTLEDLPDRIDSSPQEGQFEGLDLAGYSLHELEECAIRQTLDMCKNNRTKAADMLGISVRTLQRRLKTLDYDG